MASIKAAAALSKDSHLTRSKDSKTSSMKSSARMRERSLKGKNFHQALNSKLDILQEQKKKEEEERNKRF